MKYIGLIKWYDIDKGFGVISTLVPNKKDTIDVFLHHSCINGIFKKSYTTLPLVFETKKRNKGLGAVNCDVFDCSSEQWKLIFSQLEYNVQVDTPNGTKNVMQACISITQKTEDINCFIAEFEKWTSTHPISSINDLIPFGINNKNIYIKEFNDAIFNYLDSHSLTYSITKEICDDHKYSNHLNTEMSYIEQLIIRFYKETQNAKQFMSLATYVSEEQKQKMENIIKKTISAEEYLELWIEGLCTSLPHNYLTNYFDDEEDKYKKASEWIKQGRVSSDIIHQSMLNTLKSIKEQCWHKSFKTKFLIVEYLRNSDSISKEILYQTFNTEISNFFDWIFDDTDLIHFELICKLFILLPDQYQIRALKKVFYCKSINQLNFSVSDLKRLLLDNQASTNELSKNNSSPNLSVVIIIEALISYSTVGRFLTDKELFTILFRNVCYNQKKLLYVSHFFDECQGKKYRSYSKFEDETNYIIPVLDKNGRRWYVLKYKYNEIILNAVKSIPGRIWHPNLKVWIIPSSSYEHVLDFAKENRFLLLNKDFQPQNIPQDIKDLLQECDENKIKKDNVNLSVIRISQENRPPYNGFLCEGRESQEKDGTWWCYGHLPCNECAMRIHTNSDWQQYTLLDFCKILNLDVSEENKYGHFSTGSYVLFITTINNFNKLLNHMYCRECDSVLYPVESNYSVNGATTFKCVNESCSENGKKIYLNHCYTLKCRDIIDDRDSQKCPNGLVICKTCGACCSTEMFKYRLQRLQQAGSQFIPQDLIWKVYNNAGHAEKNQYYCYNCGELLNNNCENLYCSNCKTIIRYDNKLMNQKSRTRIYKTIGAD